MTCVNLWSHLAHRFVGWKVFQKKVVEKIKTPCLFYNFFLRKSCWLWDNLEQYGRDRQATDDNTIRRLRIGCRVTKATHKHSRRKCNIYLFSATAIVKRTRLSVSVIRTLPVLFVVPLLLQWITRRVFILHFVALWSKMNTYKDT